MKPKRKGKSRAGRKALGVKRTNLADMPVQEAMEAAEIGHTTEAVRSVMQALQILDGFETKCLKEIPDENARNDILRKVGIMPGTKDSLQPGENMIAGFSRMLVRWLLESYRSRGLPLRQVADQMARESQHVADPLALALLDIGCRTAKPATISDATLRAELKGELDSALKNGTSLRALFTTDLASRIIEAPATGGETVKDALARLPMERIMELLKMRMLNYDEITVRAALRALGVKRQIGRPKHPGK